MMASQKIYIIFGVPKPARNRKAAESVVRIELTIATSDLNQRLSKSTKNNAVKTAIMIDGNLIEYSERPKMLVLSFWMRRYGRSITCPFAMKF